MAATPVNILIVLQNVKQCLRTNISYIVSLFWVLKFSLSTSSPNGGRTQTNLIASNVVHYVDLDDHQKQIDEMLVNLVQWFGPLLIWLIFNFLNTTKNKVDMTTVSEIPLARPNGKNLETSKLKLKKKLRKLARRIRSMQWWRSSWVQCLVIFALVVNYAHAEPCRNSDTQVLTATCECENQNKCAVSVHSSPVTIFLDLLRLLLYQYFLTHFNSFFSFIFFLIYLWPFYVIVLIITFCSTI